MSMILVQPNVLNSSSNVVTHFICFFCQLLSFFVAFSIFQMVVRRSIVLVGWCFH